MLGVALVVLDAAGTGVLPVVTGDTVVSAGAFGTAAGAVGAVTASDALFVCDGVPHATDAALAPSASSAARANRSGGARRAGA
jgi:hypothetical protein